MRIIIGVFLVIAAFPFLGQTANGQMVGLEVQPQRFEKCLVYHLRKLDEYASNEDLKSVCTSANSWSPESHSYVFPSRAIQAFYNAENAYCGAPGCTSTGMDMRLVLIGDPLLNMFIAPSKAKAANEPDAVTIVVTTTLVDFVLRSAHALMNDFLEDPQLAPQGFKAWLEGLNRLGGKSCALTVKWNNTSLSPKISEDTLIRLAMTTFQFLFAHEIAHLRSNQTCGYKKNPALTSEMNALGVERACDRQAFEQLTKSGIAMPLFAVATMVGWEHYVTLKRPEIVKSFPGGEIKFKEAYPVLHLKDRSRVFVNDWEAACRGGMNSPMCSFWERLVVEAKKILNSPAPAGCIP